MMIPLDVLIFEGVRLWESFVRIVIDGLISKDYIASRFISLIVRFGSSS